MDPAVKEKWVAALRSGKYKQAKGVLHRDDSFCCLGVLCDVLHPERWVQDYNGLYAMDGDYSALPNTIIVEAGLPRDKFGPSVAIGTSENALSGHNDSGRSFTEIADAIERAL